MSPRRFSKSSPCPICGGHPELARGKGVRCAGFVSDDGAFAHCTRADKAGGLQATDAVPPTYGHRLEGSCRCGVSHGGYVPPARSSTAAPRVYSDAHFTNDEAGAPWDYLSANGTVLYRKARHAGKNFMIYHRAAGGWVAGRGADPVLLDLPMVRKAIADGRTIVFAEGEKKARLLQVLGFAATTPDVGAPTFRPEDVEGVLGAARVVLIVDNDGAGRGRGERAAPMLHEAGVPDVRVLLLPDLAEGEGVDDWLAREPADTARATLEGLMRAAPRWQPAPSAVYAASDNRKANPWDAATDVHDFLGATEPETDWLVPNLVMRGAVTMWVSPRGLGKTLLAHWIAADLALRGISVLLIDRDNPPRELRRRLRAWGLEAIPRERFMVIARDKAPPLTDAAGWRQFPVGKYDLVILDAFDSATEGVGEQDSSKSSVAVAALLDVVRGTVGPAALILGNTIKSGSHGRGSGVVEDRLDVIYEVRDATGFTPSGTKDWWLELPASGRDAWGDRASRRTRRESYRLAYIATKFRVGEEPDPFAFEIECGSEPWTVTNVTSTLVAAGEQAARDAAQAKASIMDAAAVALAELIRSQKSVELNDVAIPFLEKEHGLSRKASRELIKGRMDADWSVVGGGKRNDPRALVPPVSPEGTAGNGASPDPHEQRDSSNPIPADGAGSGRQETTPTKPAPDAGLLDPGFLPDTPTIPNAKDLMDTLASEVDR